MYSGVAVLLGILFGALSGTIEAVAIGFCISNMLILYPGVRIAGKLIGVTFRNILSTVWQPLFASICMASILLLFDLSVSKQFSELERLLWESCIGLVSYFISLRVIMPDVVSEIRQVFLEKKRVETSPWEKRDADSTCKYTRE
jgi:hypothetical protein